MNIPIYDVFIDDEVIGLTAVSFVDKPAIDVDFVYMQEQAQKQLMYLSSDKHEVVSPILIPNQLIYREDEEGNPFYLRWTPETIKQAAIGFIANGFWNNVTIMHASFFNKDLKYEDCLEKDVYLLKMWLIEDEKTDIANTKYGFSLPKGTLMCHYKIHNRKLWARIKSGELKGLSIEAYSKIINTKEEIKMNKTEITNKNLSLFQKFIAFVNEVASDAEAIADQAEKDETESGEVSLKYFVDNEHYIEVDAEGFCRDEEENLVSEGKYLLSDGNYLIVDENNKFVGTETNAEDNEDEVPEEAPIAESKEEEKEKKDDEENKDENGEPEAVIDDVPADNGSEGDEQGNDTEVEDASEEDAEDAAVEEELVPFMLDGVEYNLPQAIVDYINILIGNREELIQDIQQMKERIPSTDPIPTVIGQSKDEVDETDGLVNAIRLLNRKK